LKGEVVEARGTKDVALEVVLTKKTAQNQKERGGGGKKPSKIKPHLFDNQEGEVGEMEGRIKKKIIKGLTMKQVPTIPGKGENSEKVGFTKRGAGGGSSRKKSLPETAQQCQCRFRCMKRKRTQTEKGGGKGM